MSGDLDIVGIREGEPKDAAFVLDSWLMSFRSSHFSGPISFKRYRAVYTEEVTDLVTRDRATVNVAYNRHDPAQIFGFLCFESGHRHPVLHYIYVKQAFRNRGIGKLLTDDAGINLRRRFFYTYRTPLAHDLTKRDGKFERGKFEPKIAREEPKGETAHVQS